MSFGTKSVKYLWTLAKLQQNPALKSNYYLRLEEISKFDSGELLSKLDKSKGRCPKCLIEYNLDVECRIHPEEKLSKFARKLLHKRDLTKFQKKYLKKLQQKINTNALDVTCSYCNEVSHTKLKKPRKQKVFKQVVVQEVIKKRPKKQNRDKFCGLNKEVVMSLKPQSNTNGNILSKPETQNNIVGNLQFQMLSVDQMKKNEAMKKRRLKRLQNIIKDNRKVGDKDKGKNQSSYNQNVKGLQNFLSMLR